MAKTVDPKLKGIVVFYINVGQLAPDKAEAFTEKIKDRFADLLSRLKANGYEHVFLPTRDRTTQIEYLQLA